MFFISKKFASFSTTILLEILEKNLYFWKRCPALLYGITYLMAVYAFSFSLSQILFPCICLWGPLFFKSFTCKKSRALFLLNIALFSITLSYLHTQYDLPLIKDVLGKAHLKINSIQLQNSFFGKKWTYKCTIRSFFTPTSTGSLQRIGKNFPCTITFTEKEEINRPLANREYWVEGKLIQKDTHSYIFKPVKSVSWLTIQKTFNFVEKRFKLKQSIKEWLKSHCSEVSSNFLLGLAIGEFDDARIRAEMNRFGLQHLMAVSGFHFAIFIAILRFIGALFLPRNILGFCLLGGIMLYTVFLGDNASVIRAFLMSFLLIGAEILGKENFSINSLGVALLLTLLYNPFLSTTMGFQFSFLATAGILIFYQSFERLLAHFLSPNRALSKLLQMPTHTQHAYYLLSLFQKGCTLSLSINVLVVPLTLYYFQQFPLLSFVYNLFFPFLVGICLILLFLSAIFMPLPFLSEILNHLNDSYTTAILQLAEAFPRALDSYFTMHLLPSFALTTYFVIVFYIAIQYHFSQDTTKVFALT